LTPAPEDVETLDGQKLVCEGKLTGRTSMRDLIAVTAINPGRDEQALPAHVR
jgi:hypothetical protein